jgi:hypothetical protein
VSGGTESMDESESVSRTCALPPAFDPLYFGRSNLQRTRSKVRVGARADLVQVCGGVQRSTVPTLSARTGRCDGRDSADAILDGTCTEDSPGCHAAAMDRVYARMLQLYVANASAEPPILTPTVLPWYPGQAQAWPSFEGVDLSEGLDCERNVQPNPERAT